MIDDNYSHGMQPSKCRSTTMDRLADRSFAFGREVDSLIGTCAWFGTDKYRRIGTVEYFDNGPGGLVYLGDMQWALLECTHTCIELEDYIECLCRSTPTNKAIKVLQIVLNRLSGMSLSWRAEWARMTREDLNE